MAEHFDIDCETVVPVNNKLLVLGKTRLYVDTNLEYYTADFNILHKRVIFAIGSNKNKLTSTKCSMYCTVVTDDFSDDEFDEMVYDWATMEFDLSRLAEIYDKMDLTDEQCMKDYHKICLNLCKRIFDVVENPGLMLNKSSS